MNNQNDGGVLADADTEAASSSGPAPAARRNKGQTLVEAFRAARIAQRPALRGDLHGARAALRQERLARLGRTAPQAAAPPTATAAPQAEPAGAAKAEPAPATEHGASVFATYCTEDRPAVTPDLPTAQPAPEPAPSAQADAAEAAPPIRLPLSTIGFGPGMIIRMRQLGIETASDLAAADPAWLRDALGDISQLVHVDVWIASARKVCAEAAA